MDIRSTRKRLRLSQADLAEKLGVTQGTISRMETGAIPLDPRTALAIEAIESRALAVPSTPTTSEGIAA